MHNMRSHIRSHPFLVIPFDPLPFRAEPTSCRGLLGYLLFGLSCEGGSLLACPGAAGGVVIRNLGVAGSAGRGWVTGSLGIVVCLLSSALILWIGSRGCLCAGMGACSCRVLGSSSMNTRPVEWPFLELIFEHCR